MKHKAHQKKYIGTYVSQKVRENMMKLLIRYVKEYRHLINSKYLVRDILNLVRSKNGKIQAADGEHDDMVMAYCHVIYVLQYGAELLRFGIDKKRCTFEKVYDEIKSYEEHVAEETVNNMVPYENEAAFENQLLNDLTTGGSNAAEYAQGGTDVYGYSHDQYNRDIMNIQQSQQHPVDVLDASDYAFFNSVNSMLF
jgi:hypothetical protein